VEKKGRVAVNAYRGKVRGGGKKKEKVKSRGQKVGVRQWLPKTVGEKKIQKKRESRKKEFEGGVAPVKSLMCKAKELAARRQKK